MSLHLNYTAVSQVFPYFSWHWQFRGVLVRYFLKCPSSWIWLMCFHGCTGTVAILEERHGGEARFSPHQRTQHPRGLQTAMVTSITGLRCRLLGFSSVTLFFLFCPQIFESESLSPTTLKRRKMKLPVLYTLLGRVLFTYIIYISLKICQFFLSVFIYLYIYSFIDSIMYLYQYWLKGIYVLTFG